MSHEALARNRAECGCACHSIGRHSLCCANCQQKETRREILMALARRPAEDRGPLRKEFWT